MSTAVQQLAKLLEESGAEFVFRHRDVKQAFQDLVGMLNRIDDDFEYLERAYPGLYNTGAGYVLRPRVLELRELLGRTGSEDQPA